jgi:hypothetical protein
MPAKKEAPPVETVPETMYHTGPFCGHVATKAVVCLIALFIGFTILIAAFGTGFAAGRFTSHGDGRNGMMGRGGYTQQYGRGMMDGSDYMNGSGRGNGKSQCPVYPDKQSSGSDSEELPPNNAPVTP